MALGRFHFAVALDSSTDPDDTTILAAPSSNAGKPERIYVLWANLNVSTLQASATVALEDGAGGTVLGVADGSAAGTIELIGRANGDEGLALSENTALNATVAGATGLVGTVTGEAVVRGG